MIDALQFLPAPPDQSLLYSGKYDPLWVVVSILLAILASYAALRASKRIDRSHEDSSRIIWSMIAAFTLGIGVWAMHFIGMMALTLPCSIQYDPVITMVSMVPGILAGAVALGIVWHHRIKRLSPLAGGVLLGAGIGTMHYTGMAAMRIQGLVRYDPYLFALSILVAIVLSFLALGIKNGAFHSKKIDNDALIAVILGGAISGMHYTAMSAAYFVKGDVAALPPTLFTTSSLAMLVTVCTMFVALGALSLATISRNREVTEQLEESEQRWKFALEGSGDGVWDWNPQTDVAVFSRRWKDMLGYAESEFPDTGSAWMDHLHAEDKDRVVSAVQRYFDQEQPEFAEEFRMRCKDGAWKWILARGKLISRDADGKPSRMIGTHTDINQRKLNEDDQRIAATAFESQESLMITDANGVILRVNQTFSETTGYTADEAVGETPRLLKSGRHDAAFYRAMWDSILRTGSWQGEIWDRRKNGEIYPVWLTISAVKNANDIVSHYVGAYIDISERKKSEEKIQHLAFYDALTHLPNRRLLMDRLHQALTSSARSGREGALLFIDLDNFKALNDTLGHEVGDFLLQQVAQRLESCVRAGDTVARLGGDEFVVVLENLSQDTRLTVTQTRSIGEKILAALSQPYLLGKYQHSCTSSIGATLFGGQEQNMDELMKQADIAMYQAKKAGRDTLSFFDQAMQSSIKARVMMENELRNALAQNQFQLHYQVQMDNSVRPLGAEALLRWQHPDLGLVTPNRFIALAEETGLIMPIGRWVLEQACAQIKLWQQQDLTRPLVLAINVSARQLHQADFAEQLRATVQKHQIDPKLLKLELTESMLLEDTEDIIDVLNGLKAFGIQFSLDDFGTGYSSLQYLKRLPLDQIKIDLSFVRDVAHDNSDREIVSTIVAIANSLNLDVIAEGVETEQQRQILNGIGCNHFQGYLFGKPMPIEEFEAELRQGVTA